MYMQTLPPLHSPEIKQEFNEYKGVAREKTPVVVTEQYNVRDNALSLAFTASSLISLLCVTIGFLTS